ncbi:VapE domain-containing protein [Limnoraphis robusta]|uniref:VapE domain-containing protein n=1 Tax=Limnoraphis robusta TaxID=1118279 RepID=UPI003CC97C62
MGERFDLEFPDIQLVKHWGLGLELKEKNTEGVIQEIAKENSYEPVRDYLEECAERYRDTNILDNLAETLFGATEPIHQTIFRKTLISAVARVYEPGCKCESVTILFSPRQGINKSRTWQTLFGQEYFCDNVGDISNKDEVAKLHRVWGCEWSELESITSKRDVAKIKSFLSTSIDLIRKPYGRGNKPIPRRAIIVGSTNRDDFLRDDTGNRRFNIIEVDKSEIDIDWLKEHRDQIWGAAVHLYKQGEKWWLTASEQKQSNEINEDFRDELPLEQEIADLVAGKDKVTTRWIIGEIKSVETDRYADQDKVSRVISKVLNRQGTWKRKKFRDDDGNSVRGYVRVNQEQTELSVETVPQTSETNSGTGTPMWNASKPSPSSDSGGRVPHVPQKKQTPQENNKPDTQPQPEPIQTQIKNSLSDAVMFKRISQKEFFSRFPDHPEETEAVIKQAEAIGRIYRKDGYIYSMSEPKLDAKDRVKIVDGQFKGRYGSVDRYNGLNKSQTHTYIVLMDLGYKTEPLILPENELKRI